MKHRHRRLSEILDRLKRLFRREPESPDDPYALVGAPKKPRPPHRSAGAAQPLG
jgi:alkanesulfonate monooxygenase SsuD/methylene tetrahydromethanopterin reductase-like flavin-dependent oxidoreductase (luciferase family)